MFRDRFTLLIAHWRLSSFYLFYFAALGAFLPYWGPYLKSRGFTAIEIGQCFAVITASKLIMPTLWGWLGDRTGKQLTIIRLASLTALLIFSFIPHIEQFQWFLLAMLLYGVFWYACLPQFEVVTLNYLDDKSHHYSKIRMWGSIGFIICVVSVGPALDTQGAFILPYIVMLLMAGIILSSLLVPKNSIKPVASSESKSIFKIVFQTRVIILLISCFIMQLSHAPYYAFFSIYAEDLGYTKWSIGWFWALGVAAEIMVFIVMHRLIPKYGAYKLLVICFISTTLRWVMIGTVASNVYWLVLAQILHAFSFGMFHSVMINIIHQYFKGGFHGRGQALYSSISFGAGGALGAFASGYLWTLQGPSFTFLLAALVSVLGLLITVFGLRNLKISSPAD